ncbi:Lrp/AsnC family transcriptional regulator [Fluviibacterium sp. DFM31]|uniref:Lrp/AsnC family transcriptional regulator n=1 Tax=Meridianimarinicoccus marinus TaxID=3231483 RepID=A0ABV3LAG4_9RHOB
MSELDALDKALIGQLRLDGRASITALAAALGVTRGTVQTHLDRLQRRGVIQRFTVDLADTSAEDLIRAIMMIEVQGNLARQVTVRLRRLKQVGQLHSTNGAWDFVAQLEATSLEDFDRVLCEIREIPGILNSETCLLLSRAF